MPCKKLSVKKFLLLSLIFFNCLQGSEKKLKNLYAALDPTSISQHLAFYELYPQSKLGEQALKDAWQLLTGGNSVDFSLSELPNSQTTLQALIALVNKPTDQELPLLDTSAISALNILSTPLHHTSLKGHQVWDEKEVFTLSLKEIDLARGLFLTQFGDDRRKIQTYEGMIDLMALQIAARLPKNASPEDKIRAINFFIFDEMGFKFPPHSLYTKDIDLYTFLPSVLDSRKGVCLGVSILYLCLAQRLDLPLEMITPPGHIYIRYKSRDKLINIETTVRGIHLDCEEYLGINTFRLQERTMREVIGMAHFNQASLAWQNGDYAQALKAYQKAESYMGDDPLLKELKGYTQLLLGDKEEGEKTLSEVKDLIPTHAIVKNNLIEDYFLGRVDPLGIAIVFKKAEEDRQSLLDKKDALEKMLVKFPFFRAGLLTLATTWLQLHRAGEALEVFETYQKIDKADPEVHFNLSMLYLQRKNYPKAWHHLQETEKIVKNYQHSPKILKELRRELLTHCPEP